MNNLVIVESPAKAKTVGKFLGPDFKVLSSHGHIRDLKPRSFSISQDTLMPEYIIPDDKLSVVKSLKDAAKKADKVWLASDEDREGEAISWHLAEVLGLDVETTNRIVFHEITKPAILAAIESPRHINKNLVNAQQARRVLDRIVGFELSPVLWRKIKPGLSAGRVQSVAVRLIVEREREIEQTEVKASYILNAILQITDNNGEIQELKAELSRRFETKEEAKAFLEACQGAELKVENIEKKPLRRSPAPPFMTSTLQQEAARRLGFSVSQTMRIAQGLYEKGYITYMRTDSLNLSTLSLQSAKQVITEQIGEKYSKVRNFHTKNKGAQEAHEAIRPTQMDVTDISGSQQERRLYRLIYLHTLASQMADATFEKTVATISVDGVEEKFLATGEVMKFDGYLRLYRTEADDEMGPMTLLPALKVGDILQAKKLVATERFGQRPARYSEASLVHKMEELGIGRPSTYAPTISTIQQRGYVEKGNKEGVKRQYIQLELLPTGSVEEIVKEELTGVEKGKLFPTDTGKIVNDYLIEWFPSILDLEFTAKVEKDFDAIADGKKDWNKLTKKFYKGFTPLVGKAAEKQTVLRVGERQLGIDPKTGKMLSVKIGRYGPVAQLGLSTDEQKPFFAQLREGQSIDTITLEEALDLFKLPRILGKIDDLEVVANVSRFGPYIAYNKKNVSIPKGIDVMEITLEQAQELINQKVEADRKRVLRTFAGGIELLNGRYGPYLSFEGKNYRLPKALSANLEELTKEQCLAVIEKTKDSGSRRK